LFPLEEALRGSGERCDLVSPRGRNEQGNGNHNVIVGGRFQKHIDVVINVDVVIILS
jgi:hypothetical protein